MKISFKRIALFQLILILFLIAVILSPYFQNFKLKDPKPEGLLSQRIYSGSLEPKSLMIVNFAPLKKELSDYISSEGVNASVYIENFRNGAFSGINEKQGFFPASLNKLPVAILIMKKIEGGELSLDTMVEIMDEDRTDSFGDLYKSKGKRVRLKVVLEKLLKDSDNTALRVLLHYIDIDDLQFIIDYYGLDMNVKNGIPYLVSPKAVSALFLSLYFSTVLEPENSEYLLNLLLSSSFDINGRAGIPEEVKIAHKFGENHYEGSNFFHDCGIMYIKEKRIFYCIMTRGMEQENAAEFVGYVVNKIYHFVERTDILLSNYRKRQ